MSVKDEAIKLRKNIDNVYEAGRQAEKQDFWDKYQNTHNPTYCKFQFAGKGWNSKTFYPKYDIRPAKGAQGLFQEFGGNEVFSLVERLNECGVVLDTTGCTVFSYIFYGTPFTEVPHIDTSNCTSLQNVYANSNNLIKASMSIKEDGSQTWSGCFSYCDKLEDFTITSGTIGKNGFDIHWSTKLSQDSLISILEACNKDVTASPVTITLPKKCIDGATDTETLLESLGGYFETTIYTYGASTLQLPHTNIKPNTVSLVPVDENGNQTNTDWIDDGNGNIIIPYYPEDQQFVGTIDYITGLISIGSGSAGSFGELNKYTKCQYTVDSAYNIALSKGYNIAFA